MIHLPLAVHVAHSEKVSFTNLLTDLANLVLCTLERMNGRTGVVHQLAANIVTAASQCRRITAE
jgi:hypothetical protein